MENNLQILHLEDSPIDAELIRTIIVSNWNDSIIQLVETKDDFMAAISGNSYSLILADNYLPGLTGGEALDISRDINPDTPFIFVSGTLGEENAIEMLKKGAVDYVLKNNLSRLNPSIERALKDSADRAQRKQIEQDLKKKNLEVEQFIYTVSHDLRSPLVTIKTFLGYLEQDLSAGDRENVGKDMHFISTAASRMEVLLNELLEVSRVGRISSNPIWLPLASLLQEVVDENAGKISSRNVEVSMHAGDLNLYGDHRRLWQIWHNLINNSIEYMGDQAAPRITVGFDRHEGETVFYVRDNGIGILPQYHEKIFGIFEKLDAKSNGVGMGLTMVRRIVELYGGRIYVDATGNEQGACFRFTLPEALHRHESL